MALVVFLRGVNVGGHRRFRPSILCQKLGHLRMINIGAAGTFVVRRAISRTKLRSEIAKHFPFELQMIICDGREIRRCRWKHRTIDAAGRSTIRFVSILSRRPRMNPTLPIRIPERGRWFLRVLAREGRFVFGVYRRDLRVISYLGKLDRFFGVPLTTRNWNTIETIVNALGAAKRPETIKTAVSM